MNRLILMRHAKSSWRDAEQSDHQRPLNARGRRDAPLVAEQLVEEGWIPTLALISDSARTEETWAWMADIFPIDVLRVNLPSLYHGTLEDIQAAVKEHAGADDIVLVLGHNPGWEDAVHQLSGESTQMKTAHAALLEPTKDPQHWRLVKVLKPHRK